MSCDPEPQLFVGPAGPMAYCGIAKELLEKFGDAVEELMRLHEQQFACIVEGDHAANRFDLLIHDANERKQNAKYAYMAHLESHGCSSKNDETDKC